MHPAAGYATIRRHRLRPTLPEMSGALTGTAIDQQAQRRVGNWLSRNLGPDLRMVRLVAERTAPPSIAVMICQTLRSTSESGEQAGYDGAKRKKGAKLHLAVDTLRHLLALQVTSVRTSIRPMSTTLY
jgi:hypothetical protein